MKPRVFPDPIFETLQTSMPHRAWGKAALWISIFTLYLDWRKASFVFLEMENCSNLVTPMHRKKRERLPMRPTGAIGKRHGVGVTSRLGWGFDRRFQKLDFLELLREFLLDTVFLWYGFGYWCLVKLESRVYVRGNWRLSRWVYVGKSNLHVYVCHGLRDMFFKEKKKNNGNVWNCLFKL